MRSQKCCAHCPGNLITPETNEFHECCQPKYVTGNLKISSLRKQVPQLKKEKNKESAYDEAGSCCEKFAFAKRLHAENLEHQPLPDKVDDKIFKNIKSQVTCCHMSRQSCACRDKEKDDEDQMRKRDRFGSVLGCKKPETKMDLAVCWETPINPIYEPRRSTHIDGSEGGSAPAIFALVQHTPNSTQATLRSNHDENCAQPVNFKDQETQKPEEEVENGSQVVNSKITGSGPYCCHCLSKDLNRARISKREKEARPRSTSTSRRCVACMEKNIKRDDPRLIKSAVGLALGQERESTTRRNGLPPAKMMVPRPRTPFARRSFCIDTLTPPFSVVNGCRDADYPEHWRLMSIYQQSYRHPQRRQHLQHH